MRRTRSLASLAVCLLVASAWAALALAQPATSHRKAVVVLAKDAGVTMSPNKYVQDNMSFSPGTVKVRSGDSITFKFDSAKSMEPHTLTIVKRSDLPRTGAQVQNCRACQQLASGHLKNPKAPPDQNNPIVHWTLNTGKPGLDAVGDSVAIQEPGPHKSVTVKVSAPAGTTLYFLCAVHPWMQGKIVVK